MRKELRRAFFAIALLCAAAMACHGRVFERSSTISDSTTALLTSGGTLAYETSISVNGGKGELAVVGFRKSIGQLVKEFGRIFNTKDIAYTGGSMGYVNATANGTVLRMTLLKLGNNVQTLVFKIQQSEADFRAGLQKPNGHMLKDMPVFPGSDPVFYARDDKSNAGLSIAETSADPAAVRGYFASQLSSSGWTPALPGGPSLLVFNNKKNEICCVFVEPAQTNGKNLITLLHKQQGIE